jgi:hypothetical protein
MNAFLQDLHYALRALRNAPGFTAATVLTLALGIGANSAIFSVVDGVLLKPLPFERGHELVALYTRDTSGRRDLSRIQIWTIGARVSNRSAKSDAGSRKV